MNNMERHIFDSEKKYRPITDFQSGKTQFLSTDILTFYRDGYSRYDECFVYEFLDQSNQIKVWAMPDDVDGQYWEKFFYAIA